MPWTCACCTRTLPDRAIEQRVVLEDNGIVSIGSDCVKRVREAGTEGYIHPTTGNGPFFTIAAAAIIASYEEEDEEEKAANAADAADALRDSLANR